MSTYQDEVSNMLLRHPYPTYMLDTSLDRKNEKKDFIFLGKRPHDYSQNFVGLYDFIRN